MIPVRFKHTFRERLPEWISAFAMLGWGFIVLSEAPELWNLKYYHVLASYASQSTWGWLTIILGSTRLIALGVNGAWRPTAHVRAFGSVLGAVVWASIIAGYMSLAWNTPDIATKTALLFLDFSAIWFAAGDAKLADLKANGVKTSAIMA